MSSPATSIVGALSPIQPRTPDSPDPTNPSWGIGRGEQWASSAQVLNTRRQQVPEGVGPEAELQELRKFFQRALCRCNSKLVPKGATIYTSGAEADTVYLIELGLAKSFVTTSHGKACLLDIFSPGDLVGELALVGHGVREEIVMAIAPTLVRVAPAEPMRQELAQLGLLSAFAYHLGARLREQQSTTALMVTCQSQVRLAATLLKLSRRRPADSPDASRRLELRLSQQELADMVGTTRSRIGAFLKDFANCGLVTLEHGSTLVVDVPRIEAYLARSLS